MKFHKHRWTNAPKTSSSDSCLHLRCTDWEKEADGQVRHLDLLQVIVEGRVLGVQSTGRLCLLALSLANCIKELTSWKKTKRL